MTGPRYAQPVVHLVSRISLVATVALVSASSAAAPAALGQDVQVDPNSPAGTEYAIPIQSAREEGSGEGKIFGEGIEQDNGGGDSTASSQETASPKKEGSANPRPAEGKDASASSASPTLNAQDAAVQVPSTQSDESSGSGPLVAVLLVTLILLVGAVLGGLRIRRRSDSRA